jgi:hypothetical protein
VDLMGFAVFRITAINGTNYVNGYAITPSVADPNDPRLRRALTAHLIRW